MPKEKPRLRSKLAGGKKASVAKAVFKVIVQRVRAGAHEIGSDYVRYVKDAQEQMALIKRYKKLEQLRKSHSEAKILFGSEEIFKNRMKKFVDEVVEKGLMDAGSAVSFQTTASAKDLVQFENILKNRLEYIKNAPKPMLPAPKPNPYEQYFVAPKYGTKEYYTSYKAINKQTGKIKQGKFDDLMDLDKRSWDIVEATPDIHKQLKQKEVKQRLQHYRNELAKKERYAKAGETYVPELPPRKEIPLAYQPASGNEPMTTKILDDFDAPSHLRRAQMQTVSGPNKGRIYYRYFETPRQRVEFERMVQEVSK